MKETVEWKDVENFIKWWESDDHDFDIYYGYTKEPCGYISINTDKIYTLRGLFDYWTLYVKE